MKSRSQSASRHERRVDQQVVGEEDRPAPGREIADHGVRQRPGAEPRGGERVVRRARPRSRPARPPRAAPHREEHQGDQQEVGAHPRAPEPRPQVEVQQHQERSSPAPAGPGWRGRDVHRAGVLGAAGAGRPASRRRRPERGRGGGCGAAAALAAARSRPASDAARGRWRPARSPAATRVGPPDLRDRIQPHRLAARSRWGRPRARSALGRRDQHQDVGRRARDWPRAAAGTPAPSPACSRTTPITVPTGIPLGYTPPRPEESTSVPGRHRVAVGHAAELERPFPAGPDSDGATTPLALPLDGEGAHPELRDGPRSWRRCECSPRGEHHPDQPLGRHHRIELGDAARRGRRSRSRVRPSVGLGLVQHLGGDVGTARSGG